MKKHFLLACSAIAALLFGACTEEDFSKGQRGNEVTFNVTIPELGTTTRAVGDGLTATTLYWGVYDHNNVLLQDISNTTNTGHKVSGGKTFSKSTKLTLTLAQDKKYSIIFWAANADNSMCDVDWEELKMTVDPKEANQESYDAFCKYEVIDNVSGYMTRDVKLKRPFAQLNIGTADIAKAAASGLTVQNTRVEIAGLHTSYDFVTEKSEGEATFNYAYPNSAVSFADEAFPIEDATYDYLSMNYALISADKQLVNVTFAYIDDDDQEHTRTYSSVPVQRNWRTNIYGNILTSDADFTVTIVPEFDGNHNVNVWDGKTLAEPTKDETNKTLEIHNAAELAWLAASVSGGETYAGWTVVLAADIDLNNEQWTPIGKGETFEGTFEGKGHIVSNLKYSTEGEDYFAGLFGCLKNATVKDLTINNVNINLGGEGTWGHIGAVAGWVEGTSLIENIEVKGSVKIEGEMTQEGSSRIGAVVGGNEEGNVSLKNVTVEADENSYVKGNSHVGGIAGQLQGQVSFENCSSNIDVSAYKFFAGGIIGCTAAKTAFNGCSTSGDVSVLAGRAGNANDLYRVGGIAGGWGDSKEAVLKLVNCSYTGALSGKDANGETAVAFDCGGYVGRGYTAAVGATVSVNGKSYVYQGNGVYLVDGVYEVSSCEGLQSILDNKEITGEVNIAFAANIAGNVTILQKEGVNLVIDGKEFKYDGEITVNGNARAKGTETLTFKNIHFDAADATENFTFISAPSKIDNKYNYSHNVTIENCTFTGNYPTTEVGSASFTGTYNLVMKNCTATNMHSILQAQSCDNTVLVEGVTVTGCKSGVSFGNTAYPTLKNSTINAAGYGVRGDGNASRGNLVIESTTITAEKPVIIRKMTTDGYAVSLDDNTTLNAGMYHVVLTKGDDDEEYVIPTVKYTVSGLKEGYKVFPTEGIIYDVDGLNAALENGEQTIKLAPGVYEGTFAPKSACVIESADADYKATIKGRVELANPNVTFKNIKFDYNDASKAEFSSAIKGNPAGHPAIIGVYGGVGSVAAFENCDFNFKSGYNTSNAPGAITHYGDVKLTLNNCSLDGNGNPIYAKTNIEMVGCNVKMYGNNAVLSLNYTSSAYVVFKNNTVKNKSTNGSKMYAMQFLSTNGKAYENMYFDVQGNTGIDVTYAAGSGYTFDNATYAEGSVKM